MVITSYTSEGWQTGLNIITDNRDHPNINQEDDMKVHKAGVKKKSRTSKGSKEQGKASADNDLAFSLAKKVAVTRSSPKKNQKTINVRPINLTTFWLLPGEIRNHVYDQIYDLNLGGKQIRLNTYLAMAKSPEPMLAASQPHRANWITLYSELKARFLSTATVSLLASAVHEEDSASETDKTTYENLLQQVPNVVINVKGLESLDASALLKLNASILSKLAIIKAGSHIQSVEVKLWLVHHFPTQSLQNIKALVERSELIAEAYEKKLTFKVACAPYDGAEGTINLAKLHGKRLHLGELKGLLEGMMKWSTYFGSSAWMVPVLEGYEFDEEE